MTKLLTKLKLVGIFSLTLMSLSINAQERIPNLSDHDHTIESQVHSHGGDLEEGYKNFIELVDHPDNFRNSFDAARFIENKGQWNSNVLFKAKLIDGAIFYEKGKIKYQFYDGAGLYDALHSGETQYTVKQHVVELNFVNSNPSVEIKSAKTYDQHKQSYFYGEKSATEVKYFQEITYSNLYSNIDFVYNSFNDHIKYDVNVHPGGDPSQIQMDYNGADKVYLHKNGALVIETSLGGVVEYAPFTYQIINGEKKEVKSNFVLNGNTVSFEFPEGYDTSTDLVIDPSLVASTYTGSTSDNWGFTAGHTGTGQMVVAGAVSGAGYPTTPGAFDLTYNGGTNSAAGGLASDVSISLYSADGTTLLASTYLGGTDDETAHSLQVDQITGDVYIMGKTRSADFPTSATAFDITHNGGGEDIFVTRLNATLSAIVASTFVGGSGVDGANVSTAFAGTGNTKFSYGDAHRGQLVFDDAGDIYVVSSSRSADFPTTAGAFDLTLGGAQDAVIFKMDNMLTGQIYSTYLGGTAVDAGFGMVVDATGTAFISGATEGGGFPATAGTIDNTYNGAVDGFLTVLNPTGSANIASTFLGTTAKDGAFYVDLDQANEPVVFGLSLGGTYPVTAGTYTDATSRQFIHGLNASLTTTNFSTVYGSASGTPSINPTGFQVDSCGKIICGGWGRSFDASTSTGLVTTAGAYQTVTDGSDFHFAVLGLNATSLVYATFVGESGGVGDHVDGGSSTFDEKGIIYQAVCASCGGSNGFPTTAGAFSTTNNAANCNNAVFKFDLDTYAPNAAGIAAVGVGCLGIPVTFTNTSGGATSYQWDFGDGSPTSTATNPSHTYTATGTYTVQLIAFNPTACITSDTTSISITIDQPTVAVATNPASGNICAGDPATLTASGALTYTWTPGGAVNPLVVSPATTTSYQVIGADINGCEDTVVTTITVFQTPTAANAGIDQAACVNPGTATLAGNNPATGTGAWTVIAGGATVTTPASFNSGVTGLSVGVNTFQWTITNGPCTATSDQITINVDASPTAANAGLDQTQCETITTAILSGNMAVSGTGTWTVIAGGGTVTTPASPTSGVTGLTTGTNTFQWTITNGTCAPSTDQITITLDAAPTVANAGTDQTACVNPGTATLAGNNPAVGSGTWTVIAGGSTVTTPGTFSSGVTGLTVGVNTFQWTITNGTCPASSDQVTINVDALPTTSAAGPDQAQCETVTTATLAGNIPTSGTGTWTVIAGGGTVTTPASPTSGVTGLTTGTNTFQWTITNGTCAPSTDQITITLDAAPTVANAGTDQTACVNPGTATLTGNNPATGTGTWTVIAGGATVTTPGAFNSGVTGLTVGVNTFQWTITNGTCPSSTDQITINVDALPTTSAAGPDQAQCETVTTATLAANVPTSGTGTWTVIAGGGAVTTPNSPSSGVTGLTSGTNTFQWTITNGTCAPSTDQITITLDAAPTVANAGTDQTACVNPGTATLVGNNPATGTGTWTVIAGGATVTTPGAFNSGVTGLTVGVNTFQWTITNGTCPASTDQITINVDAAPTVAAAGPDQNICVDNTILAGNLPTSGTGVWTLISGSGTITTPGTFNTTITGLGNGANVFQWSITNGTCAPSNDQVTITVTPDTDGDLICDGVDEDDDNDGIPDVAELPGDSDGDGIPDSLDLDSDNDGIPDIIEAGGTDADGDGQVDYPIPGDPTSMVDTDNDGLDDSVDGNNGGTSLPNPDSDGDGVNDVVDLDADNDGTPDILEAGGTDADGDGQIDGFTDVDGDGFGDINDTDDNTVVGVGDGGTSLSNPDSDNDGVNDYLDLDSDNDGIADIVENGGTDADGDGQLDGFTDVDGDGFGDAVDTDDNTNPGPADGGTSLPGGDFDQDGIANYLDLDSDNDGITDANEAGGTDADGDGILDAFADVDGDGFSDVVDTDDNTVPGVGDGGTQLPTPNTDGTGNADYLDIDADDDGIIDNIEGQTTAGYNPPSGTDSDGDGIDDEYDPDNTGNIIIPNDHDNDGTPDYQDLDSDNDGASDLLEGHDLNGNNVIDGAEVSPSGFDADGDGLDDAFDTIGLTGGTSGTNGGNGTTDPATDGIIADADSPGVGDLDFREADSDGDGINDSVDLDDDNDGIPDIAENPGDTDGDGIPDSLDLDSDNDGIPDIIEAGGTDVDGDGEIDYPIPGDPSSMNDSNNDGLDDGVAAAPLPNPDTDGDGVNDVVDLDADNDGIPDVIEAGGTDADGDGVLDGYVDVDLDGFNDLADSDDNTTPGTADGGTPLPNGDADQDGIANNLDVDSDNDGITDAIEAGGADANGDGQLDGFVDVDGDGFTDVTDTDDNTIPGAGDGGTSLPIPNTDGTGGVDYLDIDADGDGIPDNVEGQTSLGYVAPTGNDTDNDGLDDAYDTDNGGTPIAPVDTDADSTPDYLDLDSDDDGESDLLEGHDLNGNGVIDGAEIAPSGFDADGDGLDDNFDVIALIAGTSGTNAGNGTVSPLTDGIFADADNPAVGNLDFREIDTDGDGIDNSVDEDDDNDGIPDVAELPGDSDGDGIPDSLDLDSDNDGIPDIIEAGGTDVDGDGEIDYPVPGDPSSMNDTDGDGLADSVDPDNGGTPLANPDSDGDGVNDVVDLDADNDGTPDILEAGGTDADGDGQIDGFTDVDGDGFGDINDTDDNTVVGVGDGGTSLPNPDSDNDGVDDYLDLDSDNDGIADIVENGGTDADGDGQLDGFTDVDGDGFGDAVDTDDNTNPGPADGGTSLPGGDFDQDGIANYLDLDSDNDGITDANEAGGTDADGDGILDAFADVDGDGFSDVVDTDDNTVPGVGDGGTQLPTPNTDGTGNADYLDIDADDDGIIDNIEGQTTAGYNPPSGTDSDGDGIDDEYDPDNTGNIIIPNDHDNDGTPDYQDLDSDNDGESDLLEGHDLNGNNVIDGAEVSPSGFDADGDGLDDAFDTIGLTGGTSGTNGGNGTTDPATDGIIADADSPAVGDLDFRESDNDGDGIDDAIDLDDDNDGIPDTAENPGDTDGDGIPDSFDLDSDNDGIPDIVEAGGTDSDGDGQVDGFTDTNMDGLDDNIAATPLPNPDTDGDGVNDVVDLDSDNDGTPDVVEAGGTDADGDGIIDGFTDVDNDGFADVADTDNNNTPGAGDGGTALPNPDTDNDGVNDVHDLDSDNDGIPDVIENGGADADGDGILDGFVDVDGDGYNDVADSDDNTVPGANDGGTPLPGGDFDMDGIPNSLDVDSDNDGITDANEAGGVDADGDGQLDNYTDVDGDGFSDLVDTDDNTVPGLGDGGTSLPVPNTDNSQGADYLDIDADNDGIVDNVEGQLTAGYNAPSGMDSDGDGLDDEYDPDNTGNIIIPIDTDFDTTPDYLDSDSDNDGESDLLEGHDTNGNGIIDGTETGPTGTDADMDGLDDGFDTIILTTGTAGTNAANGTIDPATDGVFADADAPGIGDLDWRELDTDGDGISDYVDLDDDNDGIPDLLEDLDADGDGNPYTNPTDTDSDGIPDIWDLDADNDGIPDIVEAGGTDANNDGRVDDLNPDGTLINDTDNNGLDDAYDSSNGGTDIPNPDTDGDGHSNFQDVDSDNDGIYDIVEDGGVDADNDGHVDDWLDSDGDDIPDYADVDATGGTDTDGDGIDDLADVDQTGGTDTDGDGIDDLFDEDPDGDGWDNDDATAGDEDTDGDGVMDYLDLDSDNDGTPDIIEDGGTDADGDGQIDNFTDLDGDGADDNNMTDGLDDVDGDGIPDHEDLDTDNDGITDANENGKPDADGDGVLDGFTDADGDGWDDNNQTTDPTDTDGDGIPDHDELDSDNDGISDIDEGGGIDTDGDGMVDNFTDADGDGLDDGGGLTPPDTDGDGIPDFQDDDSDNDGVPDVDENDPNGDGQGPDDTDGDGIPDYQDIDDDNDGILTMDELDEDDELGYDDCDDDGTPDYLDADACGLEIPEGFSPNGDNVNDLFVIKGITSYPDASILIYNRWGNKVYESANGYANDWDGNNLFGMTTKSRALPTGTYFYVLDLGDGSEVIKGYIYLTK